jgi:hypothetical protein
MRVLACAVVVCGSGCGGSSNADSEGDPGLADHDMPPPSEPNYDVFPDLLVLLSAADGLVKSVPKSYGGPLPAAVMLQGQRVQWWVKGDSDRTRTLETTNPAAHPTDEEIDQRIDIARCEDVKGVCKPGQAMVLLNQVRFMNGRTRLAYTIKFKLLLWASSVPWESIVVDAGDLFNHYGELPPGWHQNKEEFVLADADQRIVQRLTYTKTDGKIDPRFPKLTTYLPDAIEEIESFPSGTITNTIQMGSQAELK